MISFDKQGTPLAALVFVVVLGCGSATTTTNTTNTANTAPAEAEAGEVAISPAIAESLEQIMVDTGEAGGMRGCTGTFTPEARGFFAKIYAEASKCAAADPSHPKGVVIFHSTLEEGGGLSELSVLEDEIHSPKLIQCIQDKTMAIKYPKVDPKTPCVQLVVPIRVP